MQQRLLPKENTIHNSFVRYDKTIHCEMSVRRKVSRRNVLTAKYPHRKMSLRRSDRTPKCPYSENSYGEISDDEKSYGKQSGHGHYIQWLNSCKVFENENSLN